MENRFLQTVPPACQTPVSLMACLAALLSAAGRAHADTLFTDNFDAGGGSLANWTAGGGTALYTFLDGIDYSTSTPSAANIPKSSGTLTLVNPIPLASRGHTSVTVSFNTKWLNGSTTRRLVLRYAADGVTFADVAFVTSGNPSPSSVTLTQGVPGSVVSSATTQTGYNGTAFTDQSKFQFFLSDSGGADIRAFLDDVVITAAPDFIPAHWDLDDTLAGAGGTTPAGTWDAGAKWNPAADGTGTAISLPAGRAAVFAAGAEATGAYTVTVGGTRDIAGLGFEEGTVTLSGGTALRLAGDAPVAVAPGLNATIATPLVEDGTPRVLRKTDLGTLILSGDNSGATGGMAVYGGAIRFDAPSAINGTGRNVTVFRSGAVSFGPAFGEANLAAALLDRIVAASPGTIAADHFEGTNFDFNTAGLTAAWFGAVGNVNYTGTLTPHGTTYRLGGGGGTLTLAKSNALTGGNSVIINGNVTLPADNDFTGTTTVNGGILSLHSGSPLSTGTVILSGGFLDNTSGGPRTLTANNPVTFGGNFGFARPDGTPLNDLNFGTGAVSNSGSRTITLNGAGATLNFGGVMTNTANAAQTTTVNGAGNTLSLAGYELSSNATARTNIIAGTGNLTITGPVVSGGTATTGGLTKSGSGTLTLMGVNTYPGTTTVNGGRLALLGSNTTTGATVVTLVQLQLGSPNNGGLASGSLTFGNGTQFNANIASVGDDRTIANNMILNNAHGSINGAFSLVVNGTFTNSGGNRTLTSSIVSGKSLTLAGQVNLSNDATNRILTITGTGTTLISGAITDGPGATAGALTKIGAGTLILTNTNPYAGPTTVSAGTLLVNSPGSLAGGAVAVNGGTLGGNGVIGGQVTVGAAGSLAPGAAAAVGTLSIGGGLDIAAPANGGTGKLNFELAAPAASDRIAVTGTLTIGAGTFGFSDFVFANAGGLQAGTYKLITSAGLTPGDALDPADLSGSIGSFTGALRITGNDVELVVTGGGGSPYAAWIAGFPEVGAATGFTEDADGDGIDNGVEYYFGTNPGVSGPGVIPGTAGGNIFTFTHPQSATPAGDVKAAYRWSGDLAAFHAGGTSQAGTTVTFTALPNTPSPGITTVTASVTGTPLVRLFVEVMVTPVLP